MNVDLQELVVAFEKLENNYRASPEEFLTYEEAADMEVSEVSIDRGEYFLQLLKEGKNV